MHTQPAQEHWIVQRAPCRRSSLPVRFITILFCVGFAASLVAQSQQMPATPASAAAAPLPTPKVPPRKHLLSITSQCQITPDAIYIFADFKMQLRSTPVPAELKAQVKRAYREGAGRFLWSIDCSRKTMTCEGFHMDLTPSDFGEPIKGTDAGPTIGARLKAETETFFVIEWGAYVLTIDTRQRQLALRFDTGQLAGEGFGHCGTEEWIAF